MTKRVGEKIREVGKTLRHALPFTELEIKEKRTGMPKISTDLRAAVPESEKKKKKLNANLKGNK